MKKNRRLKPGPRSGASVRSRKPTGKPVAATIGEGEGRRLAQVSFRVRPDLKAAILDEARRRRLAVQTFILLALRSEGVPLLDSDLEDLRQGAPRPGRATESMRSDMPSDRSSAPAVPIHTAADLSVLAALLAAIARPSSAQPANIVVTTTCGCRADDRPQPKSKYLNANRKG